MARSWRETSAVLLLFAGAAWLLHQRGERRVVDLRLSTSLAQAELQKVGFAPLHEAQTWIKNQQVLVWAWERAWWEQGVSLSLAPLAVSSWQRQAEVVLRGAQVVELRRVILGNPGPSLPEILVEEHVRQRLGALVPDLSTFALERLSSRDVEGLSWKRAHFGRAGPPLPPGWREELMVELAGSTVTLVKRNLIPEPSDLGVVMGRWTELTRARRLALFALGFLVAGLLLTALEETYFRMRLPWFRIAAVSMALWLLGRGVGYHQATTWFWVAASASSLLLIGGETRGQGRIWSWGLAGGLLLGCWSLFWPEIVNRFGSWVPVSGRTMGEGWLHVVGEATFQAVTEEPLLRGGLFWLVSPFLGKVGVVFLAACFGSLLHPVPAVPLSAAFLGEFFGQMGLGLMSWRLGWPSAVFARLVWELLRLGFFSPLFPWPYFWPCLILVVSLGVVWIGYKQSFSVRS